MQIRGVNLVVGQTFVRRLGGRGLRALHGGYDVIGHSEREEDHEVDGRDQREAEHQA